MAAVLSDDWYRMYSHPIYFAETFLDPGRFRGTCYRAANWQLLGLTTGRGKNDQTNQPNRPIKEILGLPLRPRFKTALHAMAERLLEKRSTENQCRSAAGYSAGRQARCQRIGSHR